MGGRAVINTNQGFIVKMKYNVNRIKWRRYVDSPNMDTVTAMAASPDGESLFVVGSMYNGGDWSVNTSLLVLRADDGGYVHNILNVKTGDTGKGEFRIFDGGL